jgi:phosphodiesterase/alkaline phosphatase D-like protein
VNTPEIVVGPLLRYVGETEATIWVETDRPRRVQVLVDGASSKPEPTWGIHGHHYALVVVTGLQPGTTTPYSVELDGISVWPHAGSTLPPSVIRTLDGRESLRLAFGSCRRAAPYDEQGLKKFGADALVALANRIMSGAGEPPDALLFVGDQVYADEPSNQMRERLREAHDKNPTSHPDIRDEVQNFEEYTWLYAESWTIPTVRWLLSTVPTCMILDDHDLRDDWNSSWSWRQETSQLPWWRDRAVGGLASYWVYQHLGNLSPRELEADATYREIREAADDDVRTKALEEFAWNADTNPDFARWSFVRDMGRVRLLVVDSRCSRHLDPDARSMLGEEEWRWFVRHANATVDHLLIGTTLPFLMLPGIHYLEGWNEATAQGAWGRAYARVAELARRAVDLEHWPAFRRSFDAMVELIEDVAARADAPASVLILSGDVHCSYVSRTHTPALDASHTKVYQLVMSPFRNPLEAGIRAVTRLFNTRTAALVCHTLARHAGVTQPNIRWSIDKGPWFSNGLMTVELRRRHAYVEVDRAVYRHGRQALVRRFRARLS